MPNDPSHTGGRLPLAIVGASARAAAASAVRAGFQPVTADLFADLDLRRIASCTRISPYPDGFLDWLRTIQPPAWMYTGALENHPELIDEMAWITPLWGNPGDVLSEVRSPLGLAAALREAGHLFPATRTTGVGVPVDGSWLIKTGRGASGSGVQLLTDENRPGVTASPPPGLPVSPSPCLFYQQRVAGVPCSAVFVGNETTALLLGVTRQLIGEPWLGAHDFQFAGSIAPYPIADKAIAEIARIGNVLVDRFALVGLFGVDFVIDGEQVWTIEVNPRYTASVEVVERATGIVALQAHAAACCGSPLTELKRSVKDGAHGKAILFAKHPVVLDEAFVEWAIGESQATPWPRLADISTSGTAIALGRPVLTVFAEGEDAADVERQLRLRVIEVERRLYADGGKRS